MKNSIIILMLLILLISCTQAINDTFNSKDLMSSKGEKLYVNSLNYGVTDDHQITIISKDKNRVKERNDTIATISGLEPFIYNFKNDTLTLFFKNRITYRVKDIFKTISINYVILDNQNFNIIRNMSFRNEIYYSVPARKEINYPTDMPKAPK